MSESETGTEAPVVDGENATAGEATEGEATATPDDVEPLLESGPQTEDLKILDNLIHGALEALLIEAKERGIDKPPYGRGPLHLPYDDYTKDYGDEDDEDDEDYDEEDEDDWDKDPPFKYEYGFNPLRFVSDYLRAHNPANPDLGFEETFEEEEQEGEEEMDAATKLLFGK